MTCAGLGLVLDWAQGPGSGPSFVITLLAGAVFDVGCVSSGRTLVDNYEWLASRANPKCNGRALVLQSPSGLVVTGKTCSPTLDL